MTIGHRDGPAPGRAQPAAAQGGAARRLAAADRRGRRVRQDGGAHPPDRLPAGRPRRRRRARSWPSPSPTRPPPRCASAWSRLIGPRARSMWVSTFHSTCVRILRNQASLLPGLNSNFSIYDADDSRRLLMMIAKDMGLDTKRYSPRLLANGISNLKNELIDPDKATFEASEGDDDLPASSPRCTANTSAGCGRPTRWTSTTSSARQSRCCRPSRRSPSTTGGGSGTSWSTSTRTPTTRSTCWCANSSATTPQDGERAGRTVRRG